MGSRFEKFSERARRVLSLAQEEAQRCYHGYIGTEHILIGLARETDGAAAQVLTGLSVDLSKVRSAVEFIIGRGEKPPHGAIGLTPRAKHVVELAVDEARRMNQTYIGTEHLLIGLLREGEGVAAGVLESLNVTLERARAETNRILGDSASSESYSLGVGAQTQGESQSPRTSDRPRLLNLDRLAGMFEEISQRLTSVDDRLTNLENTMNSRFNSLESRMAKLEERLQDR